MSAGLPGLGLSGLFVLISGLCAPFTRVVGRHRPRVRPTRVGPLFALSVVITIAVVGVWESVLIAAELLGLTPTHRSATTSAGSAPVPVLLVSLCIVAAIVAIAELALLLGRCRATPTPPPIPFPAPANSDATGHFQDPSGFGLSCHRGIGPDPSGRLFNRAS